MKGNLVYWVREGNERMRSLRLTVCSEKDSDVLSRGGLAELRRLRAQRLVSEAEKQGARLSYRDLSLILLASKSTLKRDFRSGRE
ncbi:MAG: DUF1670 domain-containing protein [Nitrospiraceae bacterium]|nr:DUF1670 domain-containing protein [Nitrospiraceae bacterium]